MKTIKFIPERFHNVKLGLTENTINECTPYYPEPIHSIWNKIAINMPSSVILDCGDYADISLPLCGVAIVTDLQSYKYDSLSTMIIKYKHIDEDKWLSFPVISEEQLEEYPAPAPWDEKENKERERKIQEASNLSDEELSSGTASDQYFNIDVCMISKTTFIPGKYDFFVSIYGLDSNHVQVEIIAKK